MARTTPKPPTRRTRNSPRKPLRATPPARSARSSSKPNYVSIRVAAPTASWSDWQKLDQASQRQYQAGDISGYRATRSAMGDMARGLERDPQLESHPRQPQAGARHRIRVRPPAWPGIGLHSRHRTLERAGASKFNSSDLPPVLRHSTVTAQPLLRILECLPCLVSATFRNSQQEASRPCANQIVSSV